MTKTDHDQIEQHAKRWVLRFKAHNSRPVSDDHRTGLTERRCFEIAHLNSCLSALEVHAALIAGKRIYSSFSYFVLET